MLSSQRQLQLMRHILTKYMLLPFRQTTLPGNLVENVFAHVRGGEVLNTYDFVDVIETATRYGWQVKSTKSTTPVTWKRAKLASADERIRESTESEAACQALGDAIIENCNSHVQSSFDKYELDQIGYARLIVGHDGAVTYFEKVLCSKLQPEIFDPSDFSWRWSPPKLTRGKEQLPALHGFNRTTGKKCWAWHGRGENQLHFYGESDWWPSQNDHRSFTFQMPSSSEVLSVDQFLEILSRLDEQLTQH